MRTLELAGMTLRLCGGNDGNGGGDGPMVLLMHGFGAPGTDLVPLGAELTNGLPATRPKGIRFAFPQAPILLPAEFGGSGGRAWWMIDMVRLQMAMMTGQMRNMMDEVPEGLADANAKINALLDALERSLNVDPKQLVLGGFSQGAMLACDVALRSDRPLAGLALLSGTFLAKEEWQPRMEQREGLPVLQSHGRSDPILPFSGAEALRDALVGAGAELLWVPFEGGHGIPPKVLQALRDFIGGALDA